MKEPRLTVLMAVHNGGRFIGKAVQSILEQTFNDFEFLIIDDASTDDSIEIIKAFHDPRIRLVRNRENMGLTRSLNFGLSQARGDYIARMDDDDLSLPTRLQAQMDFFEKNPSYGLVGTSYRYIDEEGRCIYEKILPRTSPEIKKALGITNQFAHASVMFPAQAIAAVGPYREFFRYAQDYDLFLRIAEKFEVYNIPEILTEWRVRLNSASVKYRTLQNQYAHIARISASERSKTGKDPVERQDFSPDEISSLEYLAAPSLLSRYRRKNIMANSYYYWANFFQRREKSYPPGRRYAIRLLIKSFLANPFVFLFLISKRVVDSLKWRLRLNARKADHNIQKEDT